MQKAEKQVRAPRYVAYIPETGFVEGRGYRVAFVVEGENGYRPTGEWPCPDGGVMPWFWGNDLDEARKHADAYNKEHGITKNEAFWIMFQSMMRGG